MQGDVSDMGRGTGSQQSITGVRRRKQPALPRELGNIPDWTLRHPSVFGRTRETQIKHSMWVNFPNINPVCWRMDAQFTVGALAKRERSRGWLLLCGGGSIQTVEELEANQGLELHPGGHREMWQGFEKGCGFE